LGEDPVDDPDAPVAGPDGTLEQRARLAEDRLAEVLAAYRQVRVENEGYRDRIAREIERQYDRRRERLVLRFIEILDNLDRALEAAEQSYAGNPLIEGLILVRTQLLQTLQQEGLERIPVLGLPYDPAVSEAVGTQAVSDPEHDHVVVKELMRGYRIHGRVARPSRVVVGSHRSSTAPLTPSGDDRIGADEVQQLAVEDARESDAPAAEPGEDAALDETALRAIFGDVPPRRGN
jgi:molecular chaperone GrpE